MERSECASYEREKERERESGIIHGEFATRTQLFQAEKVLRAIGSGGILALGFGRRNRCTHITMLKLSSDYSY